MNDSSTGGYLSPVTPAPADDVALDLILQAAIAAITGLPGNLVLVMGQPIPPPQPGRALTWCSFWFNVTSADINPSWVHDPTGNGSSRLFRTEELEVMASFRGPACRATATLLRDGFSVGQNREAIRAQGLAFVSVERMTRIPDLVNTQIIDRVDVVLRFRRMVARTYAILNVESLTGNVTVDGQSTTGQATLDASLQTGT